MKIIFNGYRVPVGDDGNVMEMNSSDGYRQCGCT